MIDFDDNLNVIYNNFTINKYFLTCCNYNCAQCQKKNNEKFHLQYFFVMFYGKRIKQYELISFDCR